MSWFQIHLVCGVLTIAAGIYLGMWIVIALGVIDLFGAANEKFKWINMEAE